MNTPPNILYLHSHDTGRYIQPYGHAIATPNLQHLAEEGVLFRQNFCVNPTCSPSRAALLTGSYPHENGMMGLAHRGFSLNNYGQHIIHALHTAGYTSALAGVQHIARPAENLKPWQVIGYHQCFADPAEKSAAEFLLSQPSQPFFLSVGFVDTHREFPPIDEAPDDERYCAPPSHLPDTPEIRRDMTRFKASARKLDQKMGAVLEALEKSGLAQNTLVVCTTDHGIAFPRMKCNLQDSGIGVFLIIRGPGGFSGGKVIDAMTSHLDIFPTLCEMAGVAKPAWLRGKSLLPLVNGNAPEIHDDLFFEINYHAAPEPVRAARTNRWKYIRRYDGRTKPVFPNCDDGETKTFWHENGWAERPLPSEALFDLTFDLNEMQNLAADPQYAQALHDMRSRMERWMRQTNDPLLDGPLKAPPGARINDPDGYSPTEKLYLAD